MCLTDITLIHFFLINNRCLLAGFSMAGFNSYSKVTNRSELLISMRNYNCYILMNNFLSYLVCLTDITLIHFFNNKLKVSIT